jgi:hypothetical protein
MKGYIVFNPATGEILRHGHCPDKMIFIQAGEGEAVIEGMANDVTEKIDINSFQVIGKTEDEIKRSSLPEPDPKGLQIERKKQEILHRMAVAEIEAEEKSNDAKK